MLFRSKLGVIDLAVFANGFAQFFRGDLCGFAWREVNRAGGEIFGVSRTIIRRALSRLAHEGVVLLRPNRGAVVASPSVEEARQVFFARRLVEKAITELAVVHATAEDLSQLRGMVQDERDSFSRGDRGAGIRLSGEFHLKLAEAAKNAPLISFQRSLVSQTSLIIASTRVATVRTAPTTSICN